MAVALTQQVFHGPSYCAYVMGDGSNLAWDVIGRVIAASPVPVSGGHCPGFAVGMFVAQNASIITDIIISSQHYQRLLVLIPGSLQELLHEAPLFANVSVYVVVANCSSVFHLISPHHLSFQHMSTDHDIVHRELPNLQGQTLRVATFHCPPFSYYNKWKNVKHGGFLPPGVPDGVEMAIFLALSRRLNFTWQLQDLHGGDMWGHHDANGSWSDGIVGVMSQKLADIAFCGIYIEREIMKEFDLTIPWTHYCQTFLVPRHGPSFRFAFLHTFQPILWILITIVTLCIALIFWLLSHFEQRPQGILDTMLTAVGILCLSSFPGLQTQLGSLRPLVASWSLFSLLLTTALSSGLVSHLTQPAPTTQLNSVRDLVESGLTWGQAYTQEHSTFFNLEDPWHAEFAIRFKLESYPHERESRVREGHYAILGGKLDGSERYFMEGDTLKDTGLLSQLRVMSECLICQYAALGLTKGSSLLQPVNCVLRWLLEAGLVEHWQTDLVQDFGNPEIKALFQKAQWKGPQQLSLTHLEDVFMLLCIGLAAATLVFLTEICYSHLTLE
ncbi:hypothetical protein B7P43_G12501 [Cryptotermes secundus]|uniref:Ionotropic glutamate receptor C-terminal domain-containing protein n=2 Tax=Cryptotermes secundus TaxID=105785 RepID=A0A2J7PU22_9NEOP|nr:hypothetical protein B7P43_G12501 [Cryptotermes secundus]